LVVDTNRWASNDIGEREVSTTKMAMVIYADAEI